jgi:hypothetical protein
MSTTASTPISKNCSRWLRPLASWHYTYCWATLLLTTDCQLKNDEKRKKNEIVKEALKEARKNLREEKGAKTPSATTSSAMANRKKSHRNTLQVPLSLGNMRRRSTHPTTQTGITRNGNSGSRTHTGVRDRHTRLPTATIIRLDGAHPKDVVEVTAEVAEAPTEVEAEGADGPE